MKIPYFFPLFIPVIFESPLGQYSSFSDSYNSGYVKLKWMVVEQAKKLHITDFAKVEIHTTEKPDVDYGHIGIYIFMLTQNDFLWVLFYDNSWLSITRLSKIRTSITRTVFSGPLRESYAIFPLFNSNSPLIERWLILLGIRVIDTWLYINYFQCSTISFVRTSPFMDLFYHNTPSTNK